MTKMQRVALEGLIGGALSSVLSALLLCAASRRQTGSPYAGINAISHWLWKDRAFRRNAPSLRYTGTGYLIHHLAFNVLGHRPRRRPSRRQRGRCAGCDGRRFDHQRARLLRRLQADAAPAATRLRAAALAARAGRCVPGFRRRHRCGRLAAVVAAPADPWKAPSLQPRNERMKS
ncbi:hypothetical protein [Methyloversatilis sp.]|uniref:hypothetical protein n=1 Tax=Methyloversatilis sp. TaxID=2569862 RepID=UPI003D273BF5